MGVLVGLVVASFYWGAMDVTLDQQKIDWAAHQAQEK